VSPTPLLDGAPRVLVHLRGVFAPEMADFWQRLRFALRTQHNELLLMSDMLPENPLDVPLLRYSENLDAMPAISHAQGWRPWLLERRPLDMSPYLERQRLWYGPAKEETGRVDALHQLDHFYRAVLLTARPALIILWNGNLPGEMLLSDIARGAGCPVHFIERGSFPGTVHLDDTGILAASRIAREKEWTWPNPEQRAYWHGVLATLEKTYAGGKDTWWGQPDTIGPEKLRAKWHIPSDKKILFFAGQVDRDAQNLLFSPHFKNNLAAFQWFVEALEQHHDVFILGKHHPRSPVPSETFQKLLAHRGVWLTDVSLADCLAVADRVAAVNSTVLYEGLMVNKPGLAMGNGIFSGKGFLYEVSSLENARETIHRWLTADNFDQCRQQWTDFGAHYLASALFSIRPPEHAAGIRDAEALATVLSQTLAQNTPPDYSQLSAPWPCIDEVALWHYSRPKQHQGFKEILRGANIIMKATLGKTHPPSYNRLLAWANQLWDKFTHRL